MMRTGGEAVVDALRAHDVDTVFTVPGESFLPVLDALYDARDDVTLVATRHEEGSGFAAEAYAKATGRAGVCLVTRGVGVTHASIAIHTAMQDATPLVVFVGQVPTAHKGREAFQEMDLPHAFSGVAKGAIEIPARDRVEELVARAFREATTGRPGPVLVGLPEDVLYEEAAATAVPVVEMRRPAIHPDDRDAVLQRLQRAQRPALLVGREVLDERCTDDLVRLAEVLHVPVFTAFRRFDAFPNEHDHYAGNVALGTPTSAVSGLYEADLVVILGDRLDEITAHGYRLDFTHAEVLHVAGDASLIGAWNAPTTGFVSSARHFLRSLLDGVDAGTAAPPEGRDGWVRRCRETYEEASRPEAAFADDAGAVNLSAALASVRRHAPRDVALVTDAGNFSAWVSRYYRFQEPHTHYGPIAGAMGYAVPASIGVALARRDRPVVALAGDGGFAMTMSELAVAVERALPIVFLVFVNDILATIRMHQERHFPGRPIGTDLHNPTFQGVADAFGLPARRVRSNAAFDEAIAEALASQRPVLLEVLEGKEKLAAWRPQADVDRV